MVTIKDGCGCDPCDCDWKQKLKEAYSRAIQSVNKIGDNDGSVYFPDGTGFVKLPLPRQSDVAQIKKNAQDIADLKIRDTQLQADINAETTAREKAITDEASARETAITAEASAREAKDTELDADIARIDNINAGQDQRIQDNTDRITTVNNDLTATEATVATHNTEIINLQSQTQALNKSLVSDVMMNDGTTAGSVQVSIEKEDGAVVTSANYKWGRDIGVRLEAGTQAGYIKTVISLSDGTELESNEYKIVEVLESDVYVTAITLVPDMTAGTIGGNISYSNGTTQTINSINVPTAPGVTSAIEALQSRMTSVEQKNTTQDSQISAIDARVKAIEDTPGISQFTSGKLGTIAGSTADGRVKAEDDGTGSVNGWSDLKGRVSTAEGQIVTAQGDISDLDRRVGTHDTEISGIMSDITAIEAKNTQQDTAISAINTKNTEQDTAISAINTKNTEQDAAINGKVSIAQGAENAGKALVVGSDGNIALSSLKAKSIPIYDIENQATTSGSKDTSHYKWIGFFDAPLLANLDVVIGMYKALMIDKSKSSSAATYRVTADNSVFRDVVYNLFKLQGFIDDSDNCILPDGKYNVKLVNVYSLYNAWDGYIGYENPNKSINVSNGVIDYGTNAFQYSAYTDYPLVHMCMEYITKIS